MGMLDVIRASWAPINRAGWPFVGGAGVAAAALFVIAAPLGWLGVLATLACAYFFRDPDRVTPSRAGLIMAPADGKVATIEAAEPPSELEIDGQRTRVSIFLSIFDVHINRAPASGRLAAVRYRPGKFANAGDTAASEANERQAYALEAEGDSIAFVQIAGLVARRIVCHVREDQWVDAGQRIGLIRFGSRLDIYLPPDVAPLVVAGQRCIAGETVIADTHSDETARTGEVR